MVKLWRDETLRVGGDRVMRLAYSIPVHVQADNTAVPSSTPDHDLSIYCTRGSCQRGVLVCALQRQFCPYRGRPLAMSERPFYSTASL